MQPCGGLHHNAEDHRTIIVDKIAQSRLHDEAAQFDQMPCAFAPLHLPVSHTITIVTEDQPVPLRLGSPQCCFARHEPVCQRAAADLETVPRRARAMPYAFEMPMPSEAVLAAMNGVSMSG